MYLMIERMIDKQLAHSHLINRVIRVCYKNIKYTPHRHVLLSYSDLDDDDDDGDDTCTPRLKRSTFKTQLATGFGSGLLLDVSVVVGVGVGVAQLTQTQQICILFSFVRRAGRRSRVWVCFQLNWVGRLAKIIIIKKKQYIKIIIKAIAGQLALTNKAYTL